jgi:peroxiredoxin
MAIRGKHKKRGSTLSLVLMLVALIALIVLIIFWPVDAEARTVAAKAAVEQDDLAETTLINVGDEAPNFSVEMLDGSTVTLSALRGQKVLLIFWATWCPPCRQEMSHLQEVIDANPDVVVLPISRGEKRDVVEAFLQKMGYTFPVGLDVEQTIYRKYASNYIPRSFVIDGNGKVVYVGVGYDEAIAAEVQQALAN